HAIPRLPRSLQVQRDLPEHVHRIHRSPRHSDESFPSTIYPATYPTAYPRTYTRARFTRCGRRGCLNLELLRSGDASVAVRTRSGTPRERRRAWPVRTRAVKSASAIRPSRPYDGSNAQPTPTACENAPTPACGGRVRGWCARAVSWPGSRGPLTQHTGRGGVVLPQEPRWPEPSESQPDEWPESHTEQTDILPAVPPSTGDSAGDTGNTPGDSTPAEDAAETTQHIPEVTGAAATGPAESGESTTARSADTPEPATTGETAPTEHTAPTAGSAAAPSDAESTQQIAWPETDTETTQYLAAGSAPAGENAAGQSDPGQSGPGDPSANETTQYIPPVPTDDSPAP